MSISQYQAFIRTIELGNLTRAAEDLGYTQSGITHLLNSLESECDLKLIVREKSGAYATADGEQLLPYFREICGVYEEMQEKLREIHRLEAGLVRIATFNSVSVQWLPGMLADFTAEHPNIEFRLLHGTSEECDDWIASGKVDCAFVCYDKNIKYPLYPLHEDPFMAVMPKDCPLAEEETVDIAKLVELPFIRLNDGLFIEDQEIIQLFRKYGLKPNVRFAETNDYAIAAMVEQGLGVSILPEMIVGRTGRNIAVRPLTTRDTRRIGLIIKNEKRVNAATKEFIQCAQRWIEDRYGRIDG